MKKTILISILAILLIAIFVLPINQEQIITKSQTIMSSRIPYVNSIIGPISLMTYVDSIKMYNEDKIDHNFYYESLVEIYEEDNVTIDESPSGDEVCSSINLTCMNLEYKNSLNSEWVSLNQDSCLWDELKAVNNYDSSWFEGDLSNYYNGVYAEIMDLPIGPILYLKGQTYTVLSIYEGYVEIKVSEDVDGHARSEIQNISVGERGIFTTQENSRVYVDAISGATVDFTIIKPYELAFRAVCGNVKPLLTPIKTLRK